MSTAAARRLARLLKATNRKVVFAESCTGGLASGALTKIPGISQWHCGGVVVYRNETKQAFLSIPAAVLINPGPVSAEVAERMATSVLHRTPEADLAAAVTGHLGPHAPSKLDGLVFIAVAWRMRKGKEARSIVKQLRCRRDQSRLPRQRWVIEQVLTMLGDELESQRE